MFDMVLNTSLSYRDSVWFYNTGDTRAFLAQRSKPTTNTKLTSKVTNQRRIHFEELQTVSFEVELIINNKPLTYVYPNTIKTCFTPNHLLFSRQSLYSFNATSTVVKNLTVLSSTTAKINRICNHFLDRWRHGYVVHLRETQWTSKLNLNSLKININDIGLVFYRKSSQTLLEDCHSNASIT